MTSLISFRESVVTDISSLPRISSVEIAEQQDKSILEITPETIQAEERSEIESILKSVVPNYILTDSPQDTVIVLHYEKSSNTYRLFASLKEDSEQTQTTQEDHQIQTEKLDDDFEIDKITSNNNEDSETEQSTKDTSNESKENGTENIQSTDTEMNLNEDVEDIEETNSNSNKDSEK